MKDVKPVILDVMILEEAYTKHQSSASSEDTVNVY